MAGNKLKMECALNYSTIAIDDADTKENMTKNSLLFELWPNM